ncbi:Histone H4 [Mycena chlorophos]|uniref:Histone H4 n=1 Tax=Mycena chlorophos TaxID=658473 RepID=A0A8H6TSZ7_MYCCL|nr:Histone H4 [Mycena chlorophos]
MPRPVPSELAQQLTQNIVKQLNKPEITARGLEDRAKHVNKPTDVVRHRAMRVAKAERDERVDITRMMTPVKTYLGGFTRPKILSSSRWFPGGRFLVEGRKYEKPSTEAYTPHTVYVLESRYDIRQERGRTEAPEYIYGTCREFELPAVLAHYNSYRAPKNVLEWMDNARWLWGAPRHDKGSAIPGALQGNMAQRWKRLEKVHKLRVEMGLVKNSTPNAAVQEDSPAGLPALTDEQPAAPQVDGPPRFDIPDFVPRSEYMPTLSKEPLWRPIFTATLSTRPLALSVMRLINRMPTGMPFHSPISSDDRKSRASLPARLRTLRVNRFQDVLVELAAILAGARGGIPGIRFRISAEGRGIGGEGLADPIPSDLRTIHVGLGTALRTWTQAEFARLLARRSEIEVPVEKPFVLYSIDEFGKRWSFGQQQRQEIPWNGPAEGVQDEMRHQWWYQEFRILKRTLKAYSTLAADIGARRLQGRQPLAAPLVASHPQEPIDLTRVVDAAAEYDDNGPQPQREDDESDDDSDDEDDESSDEDDEDQKVQLDEDEREDNGEGYHQDGMPKLPGRWRPVMYIHDARHAMTHFRDAHNPIDEQTDVDAELAKPLDFVIYKGGSVDPNQRLSPISPYPVIGPRDPSSGKFYTADALEAFSLFVPHNLAFRALSRRMELLSTKFEDELVQGLAARHNRVDYPDLPRKYY